MLITLEEAKRQVNAGDLDHDDVYLEALVHSASAAVINYLDGAEDEFLDSAGEVVVDSSGTPLNIPHEVRLAVMLLVGEHYRFRDGSGSQRSTISMLPPSVEALLYPLRLPVAL